MEGRTGALPPSLQAWISAIGTKNREMIRSLFITHFRPLPVSRGFIDGSLINYRKVRESFELFDPYAQRMDESGFVFRPYNYRVEFENWSLEKVLAAARGTG